jgi:SAM-dependent methyltransferase
VGLRAAFERSASSKPAGVVRRLRFRGSGRYWEHRYAHGGTSGAGSHGAAAQWKAAVVNRWVAELGVTSVVDLGCGDGNQLALADYPRYLGLDRSATAIRRCVARFRDDPTKSFVRYEPDELADPAGWLRGDLALSMEVIFHLVEDDVFEDYMRRLFASAERYVLICSNDAAGGNVAPHMRYREFTAWVRARCPQWELLRREDPPPGLDLVSSCWLYGRRGGRDAAAGSA